MISAQGLSYSYRTRFGTVEAVRNGTVDAVRGIDLEVAEGEMVGFLGPNGAGKTTTVRMLTTLQTPTGGTASVAGHDVVRERAAVRRAIGYVGQSSGGSEHLVADELRTQARLQGMTPHQSAARTAELIDQFELDGFSGRPVAKLSGGQRRRVDVALGLVHRPAVLFLDEPSAGLDPQSRANLWDHLRRLRTEHGTTVFLTTHYLEEADLLCDRIIVIDGGQVIASDTAEALKGRIGGDVVTLETSRISDAATVVARLVPGCDLDTTPDGVQFHVAHAQRLLPELLRALDLADVALESVSVKRPTLDDVFLRLTGRSLREEGRPVLPVPSDGDQILSATETPNTEVTT
ncbi:ATP-binding cassette domain-containing protein [Streptomyces sp. NPDC054766]|uniref:ATP-binding cassette domain-containing protein n=1 Tax=Streptomyces rhizosphaerihabitans TaxID=1266770 RepID=UPI0021C051E0|nr:ATP-binding cassette domain-containing protein [Streptomyces rhizosphaerihabitans]MCT9007833.1 ATP-binding cassette domain-containing protein [Streptomyces rhizosphaerihabitans]